LKNGKEISLKPNDDFIVGKNKVFKISDHGKPDISQTQLSKVVVADFN
jgi:hypothetical protein